MMVEVVMAMLQSHCPPAMFSGLSLEHVVALL